MEWVETLVRRHFAERTPRTGQYTEAPCCLSRDEAYTERPPSHVHLERLFYSTILPKGQGMLSLMTQL